MIGARLVLIVLLGQSPESDSSALVARLGASRFADREAAAAGLERLGREALPALRAAHDARDPEVRSRAAALLQKIEGALLTQPTLIKLDFENRPVSEVVREVGEQSGIKLALFPENLPVWQTLRLTVHEPAPVPFWKAVDLLCDQGHFSYNPSAHVMAGGREPVLQLFYGASRPAGMVSDQGPFRVSLSGVHYQRDVSFLQQGVRAIPAPAPMPPAPPNGPLVKVRPGQPRRLGVIPGQPPGPPVDANRPAHTASTQFYAQMQVAAEPRLSLSLNGAPKVDEAVDDQGQSLAPSLAPGTAIQRASGYFGLTAGAMVPLQLPLSYPTKPGKTIKTLGGVIPLAISTRKPNPLVIPLPGASGKTFQNDDVEISIQEIKANPANRQTTIEIAVRSKDTRENSLAVGGAPGAEFVYHRPDMHQQQLEVVDTLGRPIPWYPSSFDAEGSRMTLTLNPPDPAAAPSHLRYYGLARATADVHFSFKDIPLE